MKPEDETIFEYRASKEILNAPAIEKALAIPHESGTVNTGCGPVDFLIYRPQNTKKEDILPVVFSFHGGGFVLGYYEADGVCCQKLADLTGCAFVNVDYPLAPEYKFPKPVYATYDALCEILARADRYRFDASRVIVMGYSAGGCMAADMCLINRDQKKIALHGQILSYAPLRQSLSAEDRKALDPDKAISPSRMLQYIQWYFADLADLDDPLASPAIADLGDLPDALVIGAEYDSLCHEEELFVKHAVEAGTKAEFILYKDSCHGFTHDNLKEYNPQAANAAFAKMADFIKSHLHPEQK